MILAIVVSFLSATVGDARAAAWDGFFGRSPFATGAPEAVSDQPHPAVVRVVVPEGEATSYGSGTLIDVRENYGLVITAWHVVRDGQGEAEVVFPNGFRSKARPLKVDADWDLAALVIWKPPVAPVKIAAVAPQQNDRLTICGYGSGQYRAATGRCTKYYAPRVDFPEHMVELDVEARQGDSGGPIFNDRGELAGVLFGAGRGTTLGSFGGRVESFLATLAPDIGRGGGDGSQGAPAPTLAAVDSSARMARPLAVGGAPIGADFGSFVAAEGLGPRGGPAGAEVIAASWQPVEAPQGFASTPTGFFSHARNVLAAIGVLAIVVQALRVIR